MPNSTGGTLTASADPGATLVVHFEGTGIRVVHSKGPEGSTFTAQTDDGSAITADGHGETYTYGHLLTMEDLPDAQHTLTVTNGEGAIWIEAIQVRGNLVSNQVIPPLPPLTPLLVDGFDTHDHPMRVVEGAFAFVPQEKGHALQIENARTAYAPLGNLRDVALETRFQLGSGQFKLTLRQSEAGDYSVTLGQDGIVSLDRSGRLLQTAPGPNLAGTDWHILHFSVIDDIVRVMIDDQEILVVRDPDPLPAGQIVFSGESARSSSTNSLSWFRRLLNLRRLPLPVK